MLYRSITLTFFVTYSLSGCSETLSEAKKNEFVQVSKSAKNANVISKMDDNLAKLAKRLDSHPIDIPRGGSDDLQVATRAVDALIAYSEVDQVENLIRECLIYYAASARKKAPKYSVLIDSAASHLDATLVKQKDPKFLASPNYAVFDFIRAVFYILTDDALGIDSSSDITKALECSSGVAASCVGPSNKLNQEMLDSMQVVTQVFPGGDDLDRQVGKILFAPIYVFLNHQFIDYEIREWIVKLTVALANMVANAPTDPQEQEEYFRDASRRLEYTQADQLMVHRISRNLDTIQRHLALRGFDAPSRRNEIRFSAPMTAALDSLHM
jgi:hypothetical protein